MPLNHPAAWRGEELAQRSDWEQHWTSDELQLLIDASQCSTPEEITAAWANTPVAQRMSRIQHSLEKESGGVWLRGLDVDAFSLEQLEQVFAALASMVGTAVSQSAKGERIFHVRDEGFGDRDSRTRGPNTNKRLSFHTDRCDVIGFLCVQPAMEGGDNQVVSSVTLYNEIEKSRPDLLKVLQQSYLYKRHNVDLNHPDPFIQQPIFSIFDGHFAANMLRVLIERAYADPASPDMTSLQREALDYVETLAEDPQRHYTFRQQRGDIVFLNNFVTFHRRTAFTDHEAPERRRHLLRVWLSPPNNRPLDPRFQGNYGSTAAGTVRGGMRPN